MLPVLPAPSASPPAQSLAGGRSGTAGLYTALPTDQPGGAFGGHLDLREAASVEVVELAGFHVPPPTTDWPTPKLILEAFEPAQLGAATPQVPQSATPGITGLQESSGEPSILPTSDEQHGEIVKTGVEPAPEAGLATIAPSGVQPSVPPGVTLSLLQDRTLAATGLSNDPVDDRYTAGAEAREDVGDHGPTSSLQEIVPATMGVPYSIVPVAADIVDGRTGQLRAVPQTGIATRRLAAPGEGAADPAVSSATVPVGLPNQEGSSEDATNPNGPSSPGSTPGRVNAFQTAAAPAPFDVPLSVGAELSAVPAAPDGVEAKTAVSSHDDRQVAPSDIRRASERPSAIAPEQPDGKLQSPALPAERDGALPPQPSTIATPSAPQLSETRTASPPASIDPPLPFFSPRFAEQVGLVIARRLGPGGGSEELVLRIEPADLGRIQVQLRFDEQGGVQAVISADQPRVLEQLRLGGAELQRAMAEAGLKGDVAAPRFEGRADTPAGQNGSSFSGSSQGQGQGHHDAPHQQQRSANARMLADFFPDPAAPAFRPVASPGRIDLLA